MEAQAIALAAVELVPRQGQEAAMGPVERAIRARFRAPEALRTIGRGRPFELSRIDGDGFVIRLGSKRTPTLLDWEVAESIVPFLQQHPGWVLSGGVHSLGSIPGSLDQHLKKAIKRDVANWIVVILGEAGVVNVEPGPPLCVRLAAEFVNA